MPGPLPKPAGQRRRNNPPTIPTTELPASGRAGSVPKPPRWIPLGPAGSAWWKWAWKTPQAAAWAPGHEVALARRAALEDDVESSRLPLVREMRELDDRFGLTPKGMAALRWQVVADKEPVEQKPATIRRLQAVDSAAG